MTVQSSRAELLQKYEHEHWMRRAIQQAESAQRIHEVPVGAVVVLHDRIIGDGYNRSIVDHDPSAHAEIIALRSAAARLRNHRLPGASLYVTIEPCVMCAGAIIQARIRTVVFGAYDSKAGAAGSVFDMLNERALNHQCRVIGSVLEPQCANLIQGFFQARRSSAVR